MKPRLFITALVVTTFLPLGIVWKNLMIIQALSVAASMLVLAGIAVWSVWRKN